MQRLFLASRDVFPSYVYLKLGSRNRRGPIMLRKIWIVLGAVALVTTELHVGPLAGDRHPPADMAVAVGDFNQDGQLDLVTANALSDGVSVLINQGGPLPIGLDIKPDGYPNRVNPYSRGVIPVAILDSKTFDPPETNRNGGLVDIERR